MKGQLRLMGVDACMFKPKTVYSERTRLLWMFE